jgi:hypothetical protein
MQEMLWPVVRGSFGFYFSIVASDHLFIVSLFRCMLKRLNGSMIGTDREIQRWRLPRVNGVYVAGVTAGVFPGETVVAGDDNQPSDRYVSRAIRYGHEFGSSTPGDDNATGVTTDDRCLRCGWVQNALPGQTRSVPRRIYCTRRFLLWTRQFGTDAQDDALGVASDGQAFTSSGFGEHCHRPAAPVV